MIDAIETSNTEFVTCSLSSSKDSCVLATPEKKVGVVRVIHFDKADKTQIIHAHYSPIVAI